MDFFLQYLLILAVAGISFVLFFWIVLKGKCRFCKGLGYCLYGASVWGAPTFIRLNDWSNDILVQTPGYCCNHCLKGRDLFQKVHGNRTNGPGIR